MKDTGNEIYESTGWPTGFTVPTRSKRGPLWTKSADNPAKTETPNPDYLLPEVELTPPDKAVEMLAKMFPGLNTGNASDIDRALKLGVSPAVKACEALRIDPARLVVFPWIKRSALARLGSVATTHHGALIEAVVFPRLEQVYKDKSLAFSNLRAGEMATDNYLKMTDEVAEWLNTREKETTADICFSAALLDAFHGFSVDATRYEAKKENRLINGTCYLVQQMLLTQPQLLSANNHQGWDMPGDKYDYNGQSRFPSALYSYVVAGGFRFRDVLTAPANSGYGSVGFLAESLSD
ncbi:MAG: hypothetical protein WC654_05950 [Patescibacteria group bacterium]